MHQKDEQFRTRADIAEELTEHRRHFLFAIMFCGLSCGTLFLMSNNASFNQMTIQQINATVLFILLALAQIGLLWWRPGSYWFVAWAYNIISFGQFLSVLVYMPGDELRVIWFVLIITSTFTLIGTIGGWLSLLVVYGTVLILNHAGVTDYSRNALTTFSFCLFAVGAFFHAVNRQAIRFVDRIQVTTRLLEKASRTDALTGLANNVAMADAWTVLVAREKTIGFLFLDIDHFKAINDSLGHASGDIVLKTIADAVKASIDQRAVAGRIGGEEFAILLPGTTLQGAVAVAEVIRAAVEAACPRIEDQVVPVTASLGVAVSHAPHAPQSVVKREADTALYRAKQLGRNRVEAATAEAALSA